MLEMIFSFRKTENLLLRIILVAITVALTNMEVHKTHTCGEAANTDALRHAAATSNFKPRFDRIQIKTPPHAVGFLFESYRIA